ncbi:hypothetical protein IS477_RS22160, partial [Escherichia coli]
LFFNTRHASHFPVQTQTIISTHGYLYETVHKNTLPCPARFTYYQVLCLQQLLPEPDYSHNPMKAS